MGLVDMPRSTSRKDADAGDGNTFFQVTNLLRAIPLSDKAVLSTSILIDWDGTKFLFDAGPGTTTEIYDRKLGLAQIQFVLISHSHIDHFWDLVPLLWLRKMLGHKQKIRIVCPRNELQLFEWCAKVSQAGDLADVVGMRPGEKFELSHLNVEAFQVKHAEDQLCLGYAVSEQTRRRLKTEKLIEKGVPSELWRRIARGEKVNYKGEALSLEDYSYTKRRKIVYSGDTGPCDELINVAKDSTLLIIEATFLNESYQDLAREYGHMIVKDAVNIGINAKVKNILLTHRSLRHTPEEALYEANKAIQNFSEAPRVYVGKEPLTLG
jgi:ribonuclease Z